MSKTELHFLSDCRLVSLADSEVSLRGLKLANMSGRIEYDVPAGGASGLVSAQGAGFVTGRKQGSGASSLRWKSDKGFQRLAVSVASSAARGHNGDGDGGGDLWDARAQAEYGSNKYQFNVSDATAKFACTAAGGYSGNSSSQWCVPLYPDSLFLFPVVPFFIKTLSYVKN